MDSPELTPDKLPFRKVVVQWVGSHDLLLGKNLEVADLAVDTPQVEYRADNNSEGVDTSESAFPWGKSLEEAGRDN